MAARRVVTAALLATALAALWPAPALAHQRLLRAEPADGAELGSAPRELRLYFAEAVNLPFTGVTVLRADGDTIPTGELRLHPDSASVLIVPLGRERLAGPVTVRWRTASADGHPVRGELSFTVAAPPPLIRPADSEPDVTGAAPTRAEPVDPTEHHVPAAAEGAAFGAESAGYVVVRWMTFMALLGTLGAVAFALLVLPLLGRRDPATAVELADRTRPRAAGVGLASVALLALATPLRLYAQSLALHGAERALEPGLLGVMLTSTVWGWAWLLQATALMVAAAGFLAARHGAPRGWPVAALAALALALTPALSGHAAAMEGGWRVAAVAADALHVLAAGGWLGGLLVMVLAGLPAALALEPGRRATGAASLVGSFSLTALVFAGVLVLTGVTATLLHSASLDALVRSEYGRLLAIKLLIFLLVLGTGAYNYRRVQPRLAEDEAGARHLRRSATFELSVAAVVLLVTAMLVATARPFEGG